MLLKYYYWWHQNMLPITFIDSIFKTVKNRKFGDATTIGSDNKKITLKKQKKEKRDTKVIFLADPWIYEATNPIVQEANEKAGWNFQWDYNEPAQFAKYDIKKYYGWHSDSLEDPYVYNRPNNPNHHNKMRKLSTIISLNDASEYEGGQVEFDYRNKDTDRHKTVRQVFECKELKRKGTVVTFPSHIWHRVKPVTKGTRYSLVIWHLGWPFK